MGCRESAGFSCENGSLSPVAVHFPRGVESSGGVQQGMHWEVQCLVYRHSEKEHLLDLG